jgi:hypothetical protein
MSPTAVLLNRKGNTEKRPRFSSNASGLVRRKPYLQKKVSTQAENEQKKTNLFSKYKIQFFETASCPGLKISPSGYNLSASALLYKAGPDRKVVAAFPAVRKSRLVLTPFNGVSTWGAPR